MFLNGNFSDKVLHIFTVCAINAACPTHLVIGLVLITTISESNTVCNTVVKLIFLECL